MSIVWGDGGGKFAALTLTYIITHGKGCEEGGGEIGEFYGKN
jgi:hypothetical protein